MPNFRPFAIGVATAIALSSALSIGAVGAAASPATHSTPTQRASAGAVTVSTRHKGLGTFLVASGQTLYLFEKDTHDKSHCKGDCASDWPPLTTKGAPMAGAGVKASLLGETKRSNGKEQVTYNGHPLYFYAGDDKAGQTSGEGVKEFGAEWYVVNPKGSKIDDDNS
jgi:predicted lipoprotein with Yx(FWY)xxD motif